MKTVSEEQVQKTALDKDIKDLKENKWRTVRRKWTIKLLQSLKKAERKNDMTLLTQGNAIKRKSSKTTKEAQYLEEKTLKELIEKCKQIN